MTEEQLLEMLHLFAKAERYRFYNMINVILAWILPILSFILIIIDSYYLIGLGLVIINFAWNQKIMKDIIKLKVTSDELVNKIKSDLGINS